MGQSLGTERRRLVGDTVADGYSFKPFGGWDYGYNELYQVVCSFVIWALVTYSSIKINPVEGVVILAGALIKQETEERRWGNGASYVHNIQAGYCWYHYFIKNNPDGFWGSWAEMAGDLGAVFQEFVLKGAGYSHKAHYEGAITGMVIAFLFDMLRGLKVPTLGRWALAPILANIIMYTAEHNH